MDWDKLLPAILGFLSGGVLMYLGVYLSAVHRTQGTRRE